MRFIFQYLFKLWGGNNQTLVEHLYLVLVYQDYRVSGCCKYQRYGNIVLLYLIIAYWSVNCKRLTFNCNKLFKVMSQSIGCSLAMFLNVRYVLSWKIHLGIKYTRLFCSLFPLLKQSLYLSKLYCYRSHCLQK